MPDTKDLPYCDVIMKGGITSGVVYPEALVRLSRKYRFKSIGGASSTADVAVAWLMNYAPVVKSPRVIVA